MGVFNFFTKWTYKTIVKTQINSYLKFKKHNSDLDEIELYALTLSSRPFYKRDTLNLSLINYKNQSIIDVSEFKSLKDLIRKVIILEQISYDLPQNYKDELSSIMNTAINEVYEKVDKKLL